MSGSRNTQERILATVNVGVVRVVHRWLFRHFIYLLSVCRVCLHAACCMLFSQLQMKVQSAASSGLWGDCVLVVTVPE